MPFGLFGFGGLYAQKKLDSVLQQAGGHLLPNRVLLLSCQQVPILFLIHMTSPRPSFSWGLVGSDRECEKRCDYLLGGLVSLPHIVVEEVLGSFCSTGAWGGQHHALTVTEGLLDQSSQ